MRRAITASLAAIGLLALCAAAAELAARGLLAWSDARRASKVAPLSTLDVYRGVPWSKDYWSEWRRAVRLPQTLRYTGDGILHLQAFHGRAINIEDSGLRRTTHCECTQPSLRIAMYGGSMLWGHGSDDEHTIPSLVAARFERRGQRVCIRNHGEWGSTSARSVAELERDLRNGEKPDIVILYAGSYDVKETIFGNEMDNWIMEPRDDAGLALPRLLRRARRAPPTAAERLKPGDEVEIRDRSIERFLATEKTFVALARAYGFRPVVIWHPYLLASSKRMTSSEAATIRNFDKTLPVMAGAIRAAYAAMRNHHEEHFENLSGALDTESGTMFLDAGHLSPAANGLVAERIVSIIDARRASR